MPRKVYIGFERRVRFSLSTLYLSFMRQLFTHRSKNIMGNLIFRLRDDFAPRLLQHVQYGQPGPGSYSQECCIDVTERVQPVQSGIEPAIHRNITRPRGTGVVGGNVDYATGRATRQSRSGFARRLRPKQVTERKPSQKSKRSYSVHLHLDFWPRLCCATTVAFNTSTSSTPRYGNRAEISAFRVFTVPALRQTMQI